MSEAIPTIKGTYNGFPYEGPALNLKNKDPDIMKPRMVGTAHTATFVTSDAEDMRKYDVLMNLYAKGHVRVSFEERQWVPRLEAWKILLRTLHIKYIEPEDMSRAKDS